MKVVAVVIIMNLIGAVLSQQQGKLLKVPRIYNALVTSDEMLLPSQAYPALSPVLQSIQYPFPGYIATNIYQPMVTNQLPMTYAPSNDRKIQYSNTQQEAVNYDNSEDGKPSENASRDSNFEYTRINPTMRVYSSNNRQLFRPNVNNVQNEVFTDDMANAIPNSYLKNKLTLRKQYPYMGKENGQIFNIMNYDNRKVYSASSPVASELTTEHSPYDYDFSSIGKSKSSSSKVPNSLYSEDDMAGSGYRYAAPNVRTDSSETEYQEKQVPDISSYPNVNLDVIKNNKPKDPNIADVPPPPLPIGKSKSGQKKPEEYPPAPVGFV